MNQVAFAVKLKAIIERDILLKDQLDIEVQLDGSSKTWGENSFREKEDLIILAENTLNMSLASLAIAADEELDKFLGPKRPQNMQYPGNIRAIIYQIRNAFAHSLLTPTWKPKDKYRKCYSYESDKTSIKLNFATLNGQKFDYSQFTGFDHFWFLFDHAQQLVCSKRSS